jgi:hypothetical protein
VLREFVTDGHPGPAREIRWEQVVEADPAGREAPAAGKRAAPKRTGPGHARRKLSRRARLALAVMAAVAVILAIFCWRVAWPAWLVWREASFLAMCQGPNNIDSIYEPEPGLARLGGPEKAARRISLYLSLPLPHKHEALMLYGMCGQHGLEPLLAGLGSEDAAMRGAAASGLPPAAVGGSVDPQAYVPALVAALDDEHAEVRSAAITALYLTGPPAAAAIPKLAEMRLTEEKWNRFDVYCALGRIGANSPAIVSLLKSDLESGPCRHGAVAGLRKIGPGAKEAVPALVSALEGASSGLRLGIVRALGAIGPAAESAVPALEKALQDEDELVREAAAEALEKVRQAGEEAK